MFRYGMHIDTPYGILAASKIHTSSSDICYQVKGEKIRLAECKAVVSNSRYYIHAPMTSNMAGSAKNDPDQFTKNVRFARSNLTDLLQCSSCLGSGVIIHCGSCHSRELGLSTLVDNIIYSLGNYTRPHADARNPLVLIECAAGSASTGTKLGHRMEEVSYILNECLRRAPQFSNNIGVCLDTCHLHAAGYGLGTIPEVDAFLSNIDTLGISKHTVLVHLNDSKDLKGSGLDRHETLLNGQAFRGDINVLSHLINQFYKRKFDILLEKPTDSSWSNDNYDISLLKNLHGQIKTPNTTPGLYSR